MELKTLISKVSDYFAYIICYCPDFPEEDRESVDSAFTSFRRDIATIIDQTRNEDALHWFKLSLQHVDNAFDSYKEGDNAEGESSLEIARRFFTDASMGKPIRGKPNFIVDSDGIVQ